MTSWPLYAFYMALLALPLVIYLVTKPDYEKEAAPPASTSSPDPTDPALRHARPSATSNGDAQQEPAAPS